MTTPALPISNMAERHYGLTPAISESYCEAARVCLDRHHQSPKGLPISEDGRTLQTEASWEACDDRTKGAWANTTDAVEAGAYAMILAATELSHGLLAVRRAETASGADYYIGPAGAGREDLEECIRLEVSGTDREDPNELTRRLSLKVRQILQGLGSLPAMAGVVSFRECRILLQKVA